MEYPRVLFKFSECKFVKALKTVQVEEKVLQSIFVKVGLREDSKENPIPCQEYPGLRATAGIIHQLRASGPTRPSD